MSVEEIHVGDIGTVLTTTIYDGSTIVNISAATLTWMFKKPSGVVVTKAGVLVTDGTDGQVKYTVESGFLDTAGTWNYQVKVVDGSNLWYSDINEFKVYKNVQ